eukprot:10556342-Lingulodinium_polyedra.AAC.1
MCIRDRASAARAPAPRPSVDVGILVELNPAYGALTGRQLCSSPTPRHRQVPDGPVQVGIAILVAACLGQYGLLNRSVE